MDKTQTTKNADGECPQRSKKMSEVTILHDKDADASILNGKTVAVIGYGSQGTAQALCMRDSGVNVIIGSRKGPYFDRAVNDGFQVMSAAEAAK